VKEITSIIKDKTFDVLTILIDLTTDPYGLVTLLKKGT
jgi:hypothetical protein